MHHTLRSGLLSLLILPLLIIGSASFAEDADPPTHSDGTAPVLLPDVDSVTEHEVVKDGETIRYRATAGTLPLFEESNGEVRARIFFVSYERLVEDGEGGWMLPDPGDRPVTFSFNGGPGSSSVWLHLGAWGPRRVEMGDAGDLHVPPGTLVDNEATLLDRSDLVFIDPVTTGYSRAADGVDHHDFHGLERDGKAVAEFMVNPSQ